MNNAIGSSCASNANPYSVSSDALSPVLIENEIEIFDFLIVMTLDQVKCHFQKMPNWHLLREPTTGNTLLHHALSIPLGNDVKEWVIKYSFFHHPYLLNEKNSYHQTPYNYAIIENNN